MHGGAAGGGTRALREGHHRGRERKRDGAKASVLAAVQYLTDNLLK